MRIRFKIEGLNCASCAEKIERAVQDMDGVESASLNMSTGMMWISTDMEPEHLRGLVQDIADRIEPGTRFLLNEGVTEGEGSRWNLLRTIGCATVFLITLALDLSGAVGHDQSAIVFVLVFVLSGADTIVSALRGILRKDVFNESFLMTVATVGAILIGQYTEAHLNQQNHDSRRCHTSHCHYQKSHNNRDSQIGYQIPQQVAVAIPQKLSVGIRIDDERQFQSVFAWMFSDRAHRTGCLRHNGAQAVVRVCRFREEGAE